MQALSAVAGLGGPVVSQWAKWGCGYVLEVNIDPLISTLQVLVPSNL